METILSLIALVCLTAVVIAFIAVKNPWDD